MRGRAVLAVVVTALSLVGVTPSAVPAEHPVNPATGIALSPCFSDDHGTPVIRSLRLSRDTVDVTEHRRTVNVIVDVADTGGPGPASGLESVDLWTYAAAYVELARPLRTAEDGTWRATVTVPKLSSPGSWLIYAVATDRAGNATQGEGAHGFTPEPQAHLTVSSATDGHDPVLRRVRLSPATVDALSNGRTVEISVLARDLESGLFSVTARLQRVGHSEWTPDVRLRRVSGDAHRGRWVGKVVVPRWAAGGRWKPALFAYDRFGHYRALIPGSDNSGVHLPRLWVRSAPDTAAPVPVRVSVTPSTADVRAEGQKVVVDVRATDSQSGVAAVEVYVGGTHDMYLPARLVAGTRRDGVWRAIVTVGTCDVAREWDVRAESITDRRGRRFVGCCYYPTRLKRTLTLVNVDRVPPTYDSRKASTDAVQVDFTEDVVGISNASAAVFTAYGSGIDLSDRIAGSWKCADASGAHADCLRGPVRTATFVADTPLPGDYYGVLLNPEPVLDITDLAGNPAGDARRVG